MQNFKNELKKMFGLAGSLVIVYLAIRYWEKLEGFVKLAFQAATPLIIGCIMAYVINILMGFFEKQ